MENPNLNEGGKLLNSIGVRGSGDVTSQLEAKARVRFGVAQALSQGRMLFHYQPVVRAANTRFPAFYEMLARLRTPKDQVLAAGAFMPFVAEGPIGRAIDRLALTEALRMLAAQPSLRVSINLSPLSMGDEEWLSLFAAAARSRSGVLSRLIIEITEDAAISHAAQIIEFMNHVRACGCAFALDDFGAGATGFRHFRDFRFDIVKIDGSFTQGVHASPDNQALIECLMGISRHFEMMTVAERVETEADAEWLRAKGIDCFQGYLYGRPSAVPEMPALPEARDDNRAAG